MLYTRTGVADVDDGRPGRRHEGDLQRGAAQVQRADRVHRVRVRRDAWHSTQKVCTLAAFKSSRPCKQEGFKP